MLQLARWRLATAAAVTMPEALSSPRGSVPCRVPVPLDGTQRPAGGWARHPRALGTSVQSSIQTHPELRNCSKQLPSLGMGSLFVEACLCLFRVLFPKNAHSHLVKHCLHWDLDKKLTSKTNRNGVNMVGMFKVFILSLNRIKKNLYIDMLHIMVCPYGKKWENMLLWDIFLKTSL